MERRGVGKRLTDGQRVEILKLFDSGAGVSEADVARRYGVTRSAIWRLRRVGRQVLERYQEGDVESRDDRRRGSNGSNTAASSIAATSVVEALAMPQLVEQTTTFVAEAATPAVMPQTVEQPDTLPLIYMSAKAIGSVQSPGVVNWQRLSGNGDEEHFEVVNDGISVLQEGQYQVNVDLQHSQPRHSYKCVFKLWHGKKLLSQCAFPLRTHEEVALSLLELRCQLPALAKLRVEFLAPGFAFHESRIVLRLLQ